jgi:hypothetical protein
MGLSGCWAHYREAREESFANRVAEKCVEASRGTQVIVVPASTATVVEPRPSQ